MPFLKRNWVVITLVAVSLIGLGGAVWQAMAAFDVPAEMKPVVGLGQRIQGYKREKPVDIKTIDDRKAWAGEIEKMLAGEAAVVEARQRTVAFEETVTPDGKPSPAVERKPLGEDRPQVDAQNKPVMGPDGKQVIVSDVLPEPATTSTRLAFKTKYMKEIERMLARLHPGDRVSDSEAEQIRQNVLRTPKTPGQQQQGEPWALFQAADPTASSNEEWDRSRTVAMDPVAKESLRRAKLMYMYIDPDAIAQHPMVRGTEPPTANEIWQAQMLLWVQQDMVAAMARVNEPVAEKLKKDGRDWVAYVPIKRLISLQVLSIGLGGGANLSSGSAGTNTNMQTMAPAKFSFPTFTKQERNDKQFIIPIILRVVMEPEALPRLFKTLSEVGFYNVVQTDYERTPVDPMQETYVYGSKPVFTVTLQMEGYFLHSVFDKWMPPEIKTELATAIPANFEASDSGGGGGGARGRMGRVGSRAP